MKIFRGLYELMLEICAVSNIFSIFWPKTNFTSLFQTEHNVDCFSMASAHTRTSVGIVFTLS